jgi:molecular chaperone GrpE
MLRQTLSSPSRTLASGLRTAAQRQISRRQFLIAPIAAAPRSLGLQQPQQRARWYSDNANASKAAEAKEEEGAAAKEDPLAAIKKQLEAKDAEVREWKVCCFFSAYPPVSILI